MKLQQGKMDALDAAVGEISWDACGLCLHGGAFVQGCERRVVRADIDVIFCAAFKERRRKKRKYRPFNSASGICRRR